MRCLTLTILLAEELLELTLWLVGPGKGRAVKVSSGPAGLAKQSAYVDEGVENVDVFLNA